MSSQETLSPTSSDLPGLADAKQTLERRLARYRPRDSSDDAVDFLKILFEYLPLQGQIHLADDVDKCPNDAKIRQLAQSLEDGVLRPMRAHGGITPAITPSYRRRFGVEDSIENSMSGDIRSLNRARQARLRENCLARDGNQCVITKVWETNYPGRPPQPFAPLEAAHIIPFALGVFQENDYDDRRRHSETWVSIHRYFPDLRSRIGFDSEDINNEENVMMMMAFLHREFGDFNFVLEATGTVNRYRIKTFPRFSSVLLHNLPRDGIVTITSNDGRFPLPEPHLIAVHAAIGNILHLSGRGEKIQHLKRDLEDMSGPLARDGSTNIGDLLSVSELSLLMQT